jgi:type IV pilus assembly protein PilC
MNTSVDFTWILEDNVSLEKKSSREMEFGKSSFRKVTDRGRSEFCTQFAVMLRSKVSLQRSLEVLEAQTKHQRMKVVIHKLSLEIQKGNTLAQALSLQPEVFDNLFVVSAEVGQESGRLAEVFEHLARHLENINSLKRKFVQALTYPVLVISVACVVVLFFMFYIVPTFAEMFKSFHMELPATTKFILFVSAFLQRYGGYLAFLFFLLLFILWRAAARPATRQKMEEYAVNIPIMGDIILKNHIARFCRTLGTLLHAQVLLVDALETSKRIITFSGIQQEIDQILKHVKQGNAIAEPIVNSKLFPPMVSQMIAVGEETSELDIMLLKVADYFEKEIQAKVETLSSIIEPVLILLLGLLVAGILISLYLPMFEVANSIG